jgi:mono/diheme cytochrome c family protein
MTLRETGGRGRRRASRLLACGALCWVAGCASTGASESPAPGQPAEEPALATYTTEQADRGERVFGTICSVCHGRNEFTGPIFSITWRAEPVGNLFQHISTTMPQDAPGSLTADEYASIVAYMLRLNGRQPGDVELPADADALDHLRW